MKNVIVGTAGHIDHGKTCLIKALTDIDTDRLKEEKQRGITIELGFADLANDQGMDIGIIDVPGHEKFVKHMLAGIGGIDIVLLIVAADEGFMPQTTEHFEILKMLGIKKGIVVMTKIDMADEEWREIVREDIRDQVTGTFLESAPVMEVSSHTGEGIEELKKLILKTAAECGVRREEKSLLRLPIDRVFTIDGFGTVVTGTLMEGSVEPGDEVWLYPSEKKAKVRNIQVHGHSVKIARAGQRTAINLSGVKKDEIGRGNVIAFPGLLENTQMIDVKIEMFDHAKRILKSGSRLHFYYGSAEALCKAVLLDEEALSSGKSCYAQLRFEEEIAVKRDDRFILRFYSPTETIAGGKILDATAGKKKRFQEGVIKGLQIRDSGDEKAILEQIFLEEGPMLSSLDVIIKKFGKTEKESKAFVEELREEGRLVSIGENFLLHQECLKEMGEKADELLFAYHRENPVNPGMPKEEFRNKLSKRLRVSQMKNLELFVEFLIKEGWVKEKQGMISQKDFSVEYTEEQAELVKKLELKYKKARFEPPLTEDVLSECRNKKQMGQLLESMCETGKLKKLNFQYYIHSQALEAALNTLKRVLEEQGKITLAEYRDQMKTSRKYAVLILEYADENKLTTMKGDYRISCR